MQTTRSPLRKPGDEGASAAVGVDLQTEVAVYLQQSLDEQIVAGIEDGGIVVASEEPGCRKAHRLRQILRRQPFRRGGEGA